MIWASHHAPLARSGRTWPHQQPTADRAVGQPLDRFFGGAIFQPSPN